VLAAPLAAEAQQAGKVFRVGILTMGTITPDTPMWDGFIAAMREFGYVEGRNLVIRRGATGDGRPDRLPEFVAGFLRDGVDVIVTTSTRETLAAKQARSTIPIVMTLSPDPVAQGLVASLARPGGNVTGLTNLVPGISQKYVELLRDIVPSASRMVVVTGRPGPFPEIRRDLEIAAQTFAVTLSFASIQTPLDIDKAIAQAKKDGVGGIIVPLDAITGIHRKHLAKVAMQHRLPSVYWQRTYVESGGLMSYGFSTAELGRHAAVYVDKILRGAKPADLPVGATDQVRAGHQPQDRQGARPHHPAVAAAAGGSSDRIVDDIHEHENPMTSKTPLHISRAAAAAARVPTGWRSAEVLRHGTLELRWFAPPTLGLEHDPQQPHSRDDVYVITPGTGRFVRGEESVAFGPGDALFVPAHVPHRFEDFSPHFATWVLF
jgi:ABC-type uncharacterized transport system substrate-binding protein/mannose-6-phosphate isomerase-like protein (cupin superfamily)